MAKMPSVDPACETWRFLLGFYASIHLFIGLHLLASKLFFDKPISVTPVAKKLISQLMTDVELTFIYSRFPISLAPRMTVGPACAPSLCQTTPSQWREWNAWNSRLTFSLRSTRKSFLK